MKRVMKFSFFKDRVFFKLYFLNLVVFSIIIDFYIMMLMINSIIFEIR